MPLFAPPFKRNSIQAQRQHQNVTYLLSSRTVPSEQYTNQKFRVRLLSKMVYTLVAHLYTKDDQEAIKKVTAKLQEASQVYSNDKETLGWYVFAFSFRLVTPSRHQRRVQAGSRSAI